MKRFSLTFRLSAMFMCVVVAVLVVAGISFNQLSEHHFKALDRQTLTEKLESTTRILNGDSGPEDDSRVEIQLRALLGAHPDLSAIILAHDGSVLFTAPASASVPDVPEPDASQQMSEWSRDGHLYRAMTAHIHSPRQTGPVTLWLILDVTTHMHFSATLQWWFWIGLVISALASAVLGYGVARRGLKPVEHVTQVVASMSARSLKERIALDSVPPELQQLVSSFNAMLARLDESFVRMSNFSADIAHELRTPISNLRTHTEVILAKKRAPEVYEDNLYANLEEFNRLSGIIDGLLFLAKSDNGLILPAQMRVDLREVVDKRIEYFQLLADDKGIGLQVSGAGVVRGDGVMLDRVVSNLLSNALRYTAAGQSVSVRIRSSGECLSLEVENPGEPIPPEHLQRIFDRFYRVDPARREGSPHNAGLGLAIVRSLVEAHGGRVECVSEQGLTKFRMELPALLL